MPTAAERRRPRRVAQVVALAAGGLLMAGCVAQPDAEDESPGTAAEAALPDAARTTRAGAAGDADLTAEVVQYRRDAQRDVVQVKVTNHGDHAVRVERVEVVSPTFVSPPAADKDSTVGAGLSVDLVVPLAEPACAGADEVVVEETDADGAVEPGGPPGSIRHTTVLVVDGTTVELPLEDRVLQQVRSQRCAEAAVDDVIDLTWQPSWEDAGEVDGEPGLRGGLVASPVATDVPVELVVGAATTLFTVDEPVSAIAVDGPVVMEVAVTVTRCDPHAIAEDKKGYLFPVRVRVDGGDEVVVEVAVPVPERVVLQDLIDRTCR